MSDSPRIAALVVAAGSGRRMGGDVPKQYQPLQGRPMLCHSLQALLSHLAIACVQVVIQPEHRPLYEEGTRGWGQGAGKKPVSKLLPPVHGGKERSDSVRAGLEALVTHHPDYVLIHDAARPFLSHAVIDRILAALTPQAGVVPALPIHDTVRRWDGAQWQDIPREGLQRIQTPQAFPFRKILELSRTKSPATRRPPLATFTDDAALWLAAGHQLLYTQGDDRLRKMTLPQDVARAFEARTAVGMGFDVHALEPALAGRAMRIGGIDITCGQTLVGHSDADVVLHALTDALLGAMGEGDIGMHYSPKDARWKGADSAVFLQDTLAKLHAKGGTIAHTDITVIGEEPKIAPHRDAMRTRIAGLLEVPLARVSIKATTTEKLGFTGRGEGLAAQAVATVTLPEAA